MLVWQEWCDWFLGKCKDVKYRLLINHCVHRMNNPIRLMHRIIKWMAHPVGHNYLAYQWLLYISHPINVHSNHLTTEDISILSVVEITPGHRSISERFFKLTAHYSKWSVGVTDHMFMVAQQLYSQRNSKRKAGRLFQRSLFVSSAVLSVSRIEWRLCGLLALSVVHYEERQRLTGGSGRR